MYITEAKLKSKTDSSTSIDSYKKYLKYRK